MRTETFEKEIYTFDELDTQAKETVRQWIYEGLDYLSAEVGASLRKFCKHVGIDYYSIDYEEPYRNEYKINIPEGAEDLTGVRLATYIYNNYLKELYKGKYFSLWSKKEKSYKYYPEGYPVLKSKHSNWYKTLDCPFTGCCYDYTLLQPLIDFCNKPWTGFKNSIITFESLLNDCITNICHNVQEEIEYRLTDEAILEDCTANGYEFDEDGHLI